jgi:flagellar capping protein FliD
MSVTGVVSGIDWDSMVTELLETAKQPAYVQLDKRDKLELKKSLWEEIQVGLQNLQSTLSSLKLASTFQAKQVEIERIDRNTSYKGVLTATVSADAEINVYDLEVLKLANSQINRSNQFSGTLGNIFGSSGSSYFYVNAGGQNVRVDVASTDTLESLADKINTQLKTRSPAVSVTASVVDNRLILKSDDTGLEKTTQTATLTRSVNASDTLEFNVDLGAVNGGTLTVKGEDGTVYKVGEDFDIVNGNQIRWRRYDPQTPPPGVVYQDTYTAYSGDTYAVTANRSGSGDVDEGVLPFTPRSAAGVTITSGGVAYTRGDDFEVGADGSIHWLNAYDRPAAGADYEVSYVAEGGETFTFDITRSNQDVLTGTSYADFAKGTATVQQPGSRVWREGVDFDILRNSSGEAVIQWYTGGGWDAPEPGSAYDLTLQKSDGTTTTISGISRDTEDTVALPNGGKFVSEPHGTHVITYNGQTMGVYDGQTVDPAFTPSLDVGSPDADNPGTKLRINWATPTEAPEVHAKAPTYNTTYTVEYTYNANTFYLSDDGNGTLAALGLDLTDEDHYTAAQDAELLLDGEKVTRSSNSIGESYGNELIKGMTLQLKGIGQVSLDVSQNAESAVTALQDFVTAYNEVLDWINVRMTEEELDETTAATVDSDDFRMKWGLLRGNSLLRSMKDSMRRVTSQIYTAAFTQRGSRDAIYGAMSQNGVVNAGTFSVTAGGRTASIVVEPEDTLATIAAKINSPQLNGLNNPLFFDADGQAYSVPYAKAEVEDNKLIISAGTENQISLGGSTSVLSSLGLNYQYSALSQIGIKLASTGEMSTQGQSGELDFDTSAFMTALENNAEDVSTLVTSFAAQMETFVENMINSSQKEVASGVTAAQGAVVREMNAIDTEIASIDKYLESFEKRLETKQANLQAQFAAAEVSLSTMMQQATWLESVTAQLQASASSASASS